MSLGRAMGGWLADTASAADHMASRVSEVREAPSIALALFLQEVAVKAARLAADPPSSNTGGKSPPLGGKSMGSRS